VPRTPKVERTPKPPMHTRRSWAWFSRFSATTPGARGSDSDRLMRSRESRISSPVMTLTEAGTSNPYRSFRVAVTTAVSSVGNGGAPLCASAALEAGAIAVVAALRRFTAPS
jgi:hypothetical protein